MFYKFSPTNFFVKKVKKLAKKKGNFAYDVEFGGFDHTNKGQLLEQYAMAVRYEMQEFLKNKANSSGFQYTSDPCDMNHLGYCPYFHKPMSTLFAVDTKNKYKAIAKKKEEDNRSNQEKLDIKGKKKLLDFKKANKFDE